MRRFSWQPIAAAALLALLAILATLQYRWLGDVSDGERERLRTGLRTRAADLSRDFDRELTRTFVTFHFDATALETNPVAALTDAWSRADAESTVGGIVKDVFLVDGQGPLVDRPQRLDRGSRTLAPVDWPPAFDAWRRRVSHMQTLTAGKVSAALLADALDAQAPALVVPVPPVTKVEKGGRFTFMSDASGAGRTVIVWLDRQRLVGQLLPALVDRHFGTALESEYYVSVIARDDPSQVVYASSPGVSVSPKEADVATGLFDLRMTELNHLPPPPVATAAGVPVKDHVAITIVRRAAGGDGVKVLMAGGEAQGAWQVLVRNKGGSLDALVARSRYRNLSISLGVLGLLAVSFVLAFASAQRQRRLARQQMEFVAAVSHELRTPLAVIRSASDNLADGVVADRDQVRRYGSLISGEGRRLSDMVERVMEFAGISSGAPLRIRADVDLAGVVHDAVAALDDDRRDRIVIHAEGARALLTGDRDALRSAVQNLLGNAIKYSPDGSRVDVSTVVDAGTARVVVKDRGLGIDASDLPHVFKPFYRGRRAVDAQIRGTGVGLSVVRQVVRAHGGSVALVSAPGEGTTVTMVLPMAATDRADTKVASVAPSHWWNRVAWRGAGRHGGRQA